jgi:hypothetical protein
MATTGVLSDSKHPSALTGVKMVSFGYVDSTINKQSVFYRKLVLQVIPVKAQEIRHLLSLQVGDAQNLSPIYNSSIVTLRWYYIFGYDVKLLNFAHLRLLRLHQMYLENGKLFNELINYKHMAWIMSDRIRYFALQDYILWCNSTPPKHGDFVRLQWRCRPRGDKGIWLANIVYPDKGWLSDVYRRTVEGDMSRRYLDSPQGIIGSLKSAA